MFESTGKSAITAVVITELFSEDEFDEEEVVRAPPVTGFNPRIHTKCCSVCKIIEIVVNLFEYVNTSTFNQPQVNFDIDTFVQFTIFIHLCI